jgi:SAM-dependent methyltransferase
VDHGEIFKVNVNLIVMNLLVTLGLLIRFFKWHFFLRLYRIRIKIRKSLAIFFSGLFVNLFFPLLIGEVITKNYFLKKENYTNQFRNIALIITERALDIIAIAFLGIIFFVSSPEGSFGVRSSWLIALLSLIAAGVLAALFALRLKFSLKLFVSFLTGIAGWLVIYLMYFTFPAGITDILPFKSFGYIFSNYLIFYPATPMGIFLSGNYLFITLEKIILNPPLLLQTVINVRIASIAPSFIFGLAASIALLRERKKVVEEGFHFDEISDEYTEMIPEHIRLRLIDRKCSLITGNLNTKNPGGKLLGLDLGGGKGWYTSRLIDQTGADIVLVERSFNQASDAVKRDPRIKPVVADICHLPFKENSADFGFSINVFHHLSDTDAQLEAFESLSRVLKDNHNFYLHEINIHNLFFKLYMNYLFPLVKTIDEGIECWIEPGKNRFGKFISEKIVYFTFIPDFIGRGFMKLLLPVERKLESSGLNKYSAHYFRVFTNRKNRIENSPA